MDTASLGRRIWYLTDTHSSSLIPDILNSGFSCLRCGWCCRNNFDIKITQSISRPSNAVSVFPDDVRRIIRGTGLQWDDIAQPDVYSCLSDGEGMLAIGWILRRSDAGDCIFYRDHECAIYGWRPMICRCYPFFMGERGIEVMRCRGLGNKMTRERAEEMARAVKRYEMKKLRNYIGITAQLEGKLNLANLCPPLRGYEGEIVVCDGENLTRRKL